MTNDEIRIAIAKAKGYKWYAYKGCAYLVPDSSFMVRDGELLDVPGDLKQYLDADIPDWSTDIADAWELVEEAHMTVYTPGCSFAGGEYKHFEYYGAETPDGNMIYDANAAPLAICEAWLAWKAAK